MHIEKFKLDNTNVFRHNERKNKNYSNENIDATRKNKNIFFLSNGEKNMQAILAEETRKREKNQLPKLRKDAVVFCDVVVTLPACYLNKSDSEIALFFQAVRNILQEKFGKENEISIAVHMDEKTPHMHYAFAPRVNGYLNAKSLLNRQFLQGFHDYVDRGLRGSVPWYRGGIVSENVEERLQSSNNLDLKDFKELKQAKDTEKEELKQIKEKYLAIKKITDAVTDEAIKALQQGEKAPRSDRKTLDRIVGKKIQKRIQSQIDALESEKEKLENNKKKQSDKINEQENKIQELTLKGIFITETYEELVREWGNSLRLTHNALYANKSKQLEYTDTEEKIINDEEVKSFEKHRQKYETQVQGLKLEEGTFAIVPSLVASLKKLLNMLKEKARRATVKTTFLDKGRSRTRE